MCGECALRSRGLGPQGIITMPLKSFRQRSHLIRFTFYSGHRNGFEKKELVKNG